MYPGPKIWQRFFSHQLILQRGEGAQWLSGRALGSRPKGRGFEPHRRHCVVSLSKNINPSLVLVQPRKTRPFITERLLMGRKESNQTNKYRGARQSVQYIPSIQCHLNVIYEGLNGVSLKSVFSKI